jgi:cell volume regulation protein A
VGLRGAAPILFATYPKLAGLDPNNTIFNLVFFITIFSLLVQGTTVSSMATTMGVGDKSPEEGFDIDLPDEVKAALTEIEITNQKSIGKSLKDISLPPRTLVMMIRRQGHYIVPNGKTTIQQGDRLLLISEDAGQQQPTPIKSKGRFVLVESVKNFIENATKK